MKNCGETSLGSDRLTADHSNHSLHILGESRACGGVGDARIETVGHRRRHFALKIGAKRGITAHRDKERVAGDHRKDLIRSTRASAPRRPFGQFRIDPMSPDDERARSTVHVIHEHDIGFTKADFLVEQSSDAIGVVELN